MEFPLVFVYCNALNQVRELNQFINMIQESLTFIVDQVNEYLSNKIGDTPVVLNALVDQKGDIQIANDDVACTLVSLEEERIGKSQVAYEVVNGVSTMKNPPLKFNLYILFAANPRISTTNTNYGEGLKVISHIITCFQGKNVFDKYNSPDFPPGIEKLIMEVYSLPIEQQNYMWSALGAKYIPSILYRVRLIVMDDKKVHENQKAIETISTSVEGKFR